MTKVVLQVLPKENDDVCAVNVAVRKLNGLPVYGDILDTYCAIVHAAYYGRDPIAENALVLPDSMIQELTGRMNRQVVPLLVKKGLTCQEFFTTRDEAEIKNAYPDFATKPIYAVEVDLYGCIESRTDL